jgi:hypothetical protein
MGLLNELLYSVGARTQSDYHRERAVESGEATRETVRVQQAEEAEARRKANHYPCPPFDRYPKR